MVVDILKREGGRERGGKFPCAIREGKEEVNVCVGRKEEAM